MKFTKISEKYPERHKKYVVIRDNKVFTATPCSGLHKPWWIVMTMGKINQEAPPEDMKETDMWCSLDDFIEEVKDEDKR